MEHKEELLPLAYNKAKGIKLKIAELAIISDMEADAIDELVIRLAKVKAEEGKKPYTRYLKGQEWYVNDLVKKASMSDKQLLQVIYDELLPANSSFDELVGML